MNKISGVQGPSLTSSEKKNLKTSPSLIKNSHFLQILPSGFLLSTNETISRKLVGISHADQTELKL